MGAVGWRARRRLAAQPGLASRRPRAPGCAAAARPNHATRQLPVGAGRLRPGNRAVATVWRRDDDPTRRTTGPEVISVSNNYLRFTFYPSYCRKRKTQNVYFAIDDRICL